MRMSLPMIPLTLEEDNVFEMFQRGGRGDPGSCKGTELKQKLESPFPEFLSNPPSWDAPNPSSSLEQ